MQGSYQFENLESRHLEANFLAERAQLRLDGLVDLLKRHKFPSEGKVLEVGCGQGLRTKIIAKNFPQATVVGIDRSPELLNAARKMENPGEVISNLSFEEADLYDLPYPDQSFDFVYARLVFMHLEAPIRAIKSLKRILRPGGRILIEDADRDCMFFEPEPVSFSSFWKKVQDGQRRLGGDPNVGRKLAPYLKELEFKNINIETQSILGAGPEIEFLVRTLLPSLNTYLLPEERIQGEVAIQDLYNITNDPRATFYHFWFVVSAEK